MSSRYEDFLARQPRRRNYAVPLGGLALEDIVGHEAGSEYGGDIPGYDPEGLVIPEEQEIAAAVDVPDAQPKGFMENLANVFGDSPIKTQGEGLGGLISAIAGGVANYHIGKAGKQLAGRQKEAAGQRKYELEQRGKSEEGRRLFRRQALIERIKAGLKDAPKPPQTPEEIEAEAYARTRGGNRADRDFPSPTKAGKTDEPKLADMNVLSDNFRQDQDVKNYTVVRDNYKRIKQSADLKSGQGDLAVIFSFMRVLDPQSVVRETEFKNAEQAVGRLQSMFNLPSKWIHGNRLTDEGRAGFKKIAKEIHDTQRATYQTKVKLVEAQAKAFGVDPKLIVPDYGADDLSEATVGGASSSAAGPWDWLDGGKK